MGVLLLTATPSAGLADPANQAQKPGLGSAVAQPLNDLNLSRTRIPPILLQAEKGPYAPASDCVTLSAEILELDLALGPDLDVAEQPGRSTLASEAALGAVRSASTSWIPFRGVVRQVTGAEARAKAARHAALAGTVRRAYLKGVGEHLGCAPPGAPLRPPVAAVSAAPGPAPPAQAPPAPGGPGN